MGFSFFLEWAPQKTSQETKTAVGAMSGLSMVVSLLGAVISPGGLRWSKMQKKMNSIRALI